MCNKRAMNPAPASGPAEGQTVRLSDHPVEARNACSRSFPWWVLWTIWPMFFLFKSAAYSVTPIIGMLSQPIVLSITPLPLLLIGAGAIILIIELFRRNRDR